MKTKQITKHTKIYYKYMGYNPLNARDSTPSIEGGFSITKISERFFPYFESKIILFYLVGIYIFNGVVVQIYCLTVLIRTKTHKKFMCSLIMNIRNKGIKFSLLSDIMK